METDKLQNIWKNIDSEIKHKTVYEINLSLAARIRLTINKFLTFLIIDIIVCVGVIIFLIITALNRPSDPIYQVNNGIICLITIVSLVVSIVEWISLQKNKYNLPLKEWIEYRIRLLTKWLIGKNNKIYIIILPFLLLMMNMSIHVYYEHKAFLEVLMDKESITALIVGFVVGLTVSLIAVKKIRNYQMKNLESLEELRSQLSDEL